MNYTTRYYGAFRPHQIWRSHTQDLKAAIEWLHKNDISGVAYDGNPLDKLANIMPTIDPEMVQERLYGKR